MRPNEVSGLRRPYVEGPLDYRVGGSRIMTDREMLADWIGDFLWHWQGSGLSEDDAANAIMCVLSDYPTLFAQETAHHAPDAEALFDTLATRTV